jgi:Methyltransferase domain
MRRKLRPAAPIDYPRVVAQYAPGRSFADIGCMWNIHGEIAFLAEEAGATSVTGVDVIKPTDEFDRKHRERSSQVRFVKGDLHQPATAEAVGVHDVVWSTGVIYHTPHPMHLIQQLRAMTREYLIIGSATMPEVPGLEQALVFYPGLGEHDRAIHAPLLAGDARGVTTPFDPSKYFGNWWFGITPSAMRAMVENVGLTVVETHRDAFLTLLVAKA